MRPIAILLLAFALCLSASAYPNIYLYRYPQPTVVISSSISPEVLMPGDTGLVTIEIKNCAEEYIVSYQREDFSLSMPIHHTELRGTEGLKVTSNVYEDVGSIGPGDVIATYYTIEADENITDGTHFLDFSLVGGYEEDPEEINRKIPIKIDSKDPMLIKAGSEDPSSISLDIANPRQNTLNAVTIIPEAKGIEFSPEEYYIGTMEPDEIFTIDFDINALIPADTTNLNFKSKFKNGDTWHESKTRTITSRKTAAETQSNGKRDPPREENSSIGTTTATAAIALPIMIGGVYFWRRRTKKP